MSVVSDVADAIVAELNAATLSQPVSAVRAYLPQYKLSEMQALHVTVVPKGLVVANPDRSRSQSDYSFDVAVQKKYGSGSNEELDALVQLVQDIILLFRTKQRLDSFPNAFWLKTEVPVLYAPEHMEQLRQFTSVLTLTYRVIQ
ncbi:MAG: hypothetical protein JNM43_19190 [Planctomycetaceae bacterium]|nr:hypothetical protein [Planctomycetaceae bacterium]